MLVEAGIGLGTELAIRAGRSDRLRLRAVLAVEAIAPPGPWAMLQAETSQLGDGTFSLGLGWAGGGFGPRAAGLPLGASLGPVVRLDPAGETAAGVRGVVSWSLDRSIAQLQLAASALFATADPGERREVLVGLLLVLVPWAPLDIDLDSI